jgi:hypothetical protein
MHAQIALTAIRNKILICQTFRSILRPSSVAMYKNQAAVSIYNLRSPYNNIDQRCSNTFLTVAESLSWSVL